MKEREKPARAYHPIAEANEGGTTGTAKGGLPGGGGGGRPGSGPERQRHQAAVDAELRRRAQAEAEDPYAILEPEE